MLPSEHSAYNSDFGTLSHYSHDSQPSYVTASEAEADPNATSVLVGQEEVPTLVYDYLLQGTNGTIPSWIPDFIEEWPHIRESLEEELS